MASIMAMVESLVAEAAGHAGAEGPSEADTPLRERGLDSLSVVALMVSVESAFGVWFPSHLINHETFTSVRTLSAVVQGLATEESL